MLHPDLQTLPQSRLHHTTITHCKNLRVLRAIKNLITLCFWWCGKLSEQHFYAPLVGAFPGTGEAKQPPGKDGLAALAFIIPVTLRN